MVVVEEGTGVVDVDACMGRGELSSGCGFDCTSLTLPLQAKLHEGVGLPTAGTKESISLLPRWHTVLV